MAEMFSSNVISQVVREVLQNINIEDSNKYLSNGFGIFNTIEEAVEAAYKAQQEFLKRSLNDREKVIDCIRTVLRPLVKEMAERTVKETNRGRIDHKINKNLASINKTSGVEDLKSSALTGDYGLTLLEYAPFGVIGAITPVTNPTETIISNTISMTAAGNAVVFCCHPNAVNTSIWLVEKINEAIIQAVNIPNLITMTARSSMEDVDYVMNSEKINLLSITGGPFIVNKALSSGKVTIGASAGNPPVIVDETADIEQAAKDIVLGASLDNNMPCIAEKEVIVVDSVADYLIYNMEKNNALLIKDKNDIEAIKRTILKDDNKINTEFVGKSPKYIMEKAGFSCSHNPDLLIMETDASHPFAVEELMMPVLPVIRVKDFNTALDYAVKLERGFCHTAVMHSKHVDRLSLAPRTLRTTIFVKNAPSYAGIGIGGEGMTSFTIASATGHGITSPRSFSRQRRCVLHGSFSIK